jgi:hypothetical protein
MKNTDECLVFTSYNLCYNVGQKTESNAENKKPEVGE